MNDFNISFPSVIQGLGGLVFMVGLLWIFSSNKKSISWPLVVKGLVLQIIFAVAILKISFIEKGFILVSSAFVKIISFTNFGSEFLFGQFGSGTIHPALGNFAFVVLPTIIFFSALTSLLYYLGILQKVVYAMAWVMKRVMKLSGAESLSAAGNIFLGQTEAPLLIKPYLNQMTKSEIMTLMTGGMATIAGGVLAAYIGFLGGESVIEQTLFAKHLLAASIMSAPAAVVAAKILVPETEKFDNTMQLNKEKLGSNALEAISNGTTDGLKLAINVAAMLLVFTALIYMFNYFLLKTGDLTHINTWIASNTTYDNLSFQFILGYVFAPITWLIGVPYADIVTVGQLLGEKTILNEFYAYATMGNMKLDGVFHSEKAVIMSTYILCGFSNVASIGIQIGGIGALVPNRRGLLSKLGVQALIGGTVASLFTAAVVGMFF